MPSFVTGDTKKGNARGAQEYESPLLVLTDAGYEVMRVQDRHNELCDALRGGRPRLTFKMFVPGSAPTLVFDVGSTTVVPGDKSQE